MRQIILDTETTGLDPSSGHRVIEIGCVEMMDRQFTGNTLHLYLNPEREVDEGAARVHGMTLNDLRDKPLFATVAEQLRAFCREAEVIIHNAPFDTGFLNAEFARLGWGSFVEETGARIIDTLLMAREQFPGKRNNLDALCERLMVPNRHRVLHGALLDAELLGEVYLGLTRGQDSFLMDAPGAGSGGGRRNTDGSDDWPPVGLRVQAPSSAEQAAHAALLEELGKAAGNSAPIWLRG